jgi:hypothetical protein
MIELVESEAGSLVDDALENSKGVCYYTSPYCWPLDGLPAAALGNRGL